jgi:hypothetical protein
MHKTDPLTQTDSENSESSRDKYLILGYYLIVVPNERIACPSVPARGGEYGAIDKGGELPASLH